MKPNSVKIYYYKHPNGNVGDDLNPWLWPQLAPDIFTGVAYHSPETKKCVDPKDELFIGIGTILNDWLPELNTKYVYGSGAGYGASPILKNAKIYCVRGPLTSELLGLDKSYSVTDGAIMIGKLNMPIRPLKYKYAFFPHHSSSDAGMWESLCEDLGINYICPNDSPEIVIAKIQESEIVIAEAMHGAIMADTLRTPWIPVCTHPGILEFKWRDWCCSMELSYQPYNLPALWPVNTWFDKVKAGVKYSFASMMMRRLMKKGRPIISRDRVFDARLEKMDSLLNEIIDVGLNR